jgi:hypothetical protein
VDVKHKGRQKDFEYAREVGGSIEQALAIQQLYLEVWLVASRYSF